MNLPTQYLTLIIGLVIGVLFGTGITDWRALLEKDSFTDWIMVVCSVGILYFSYKAYKHTEKTWKVTRLTEQLTILNQYYNDYIEKYDVLASNDVDKINTLYRNGFFNKIVDNKIFEKSIDKINNIHIEKELYNISYTLKNDLNTFFKNYNYNIFLLEDYTYEILIKSHNFGLNLLEKQKNNFQNQYKKFENKVNDIICKL